MRNMDLLNACYKYFNRYIDEKELVELLKNLNRKILSNIEIKSIDIMTDNIIKLSDKDDSWNLITKYITSNKYFNACFNILTDYELLIFVTQDINPPFLPKLDKEELNKLIDAGINNDEREYLWRLAFNYEDDVDVNKIANYYISVKDSYYLSELVSIAEDKIKIDKNVINKILEEKV